MRLSTCSEQIEAIMSIAETLTVNRRHVLATKSKASRFATTAKDPMFSRKFRAVVATIAYAR